MRCSHCHAEALSEDSYCRSCGAELTSTAVSLMPAQKNLPALLYNPALPKRVAAGVGAVAVGVGIELLRRGVLGRLRPARAAKRALPALPSVKDILFPQNNKPVKLPRGYEIHETVVYMTRVIRRED